ncbi:transposase domain-containing protein [uncultured Oscillibacter sp.]|nr:transposase domain-containing protein [uncultured Oscillibacter sp.]
MIYSVVETAKANDLKPFECLSFLLETLPTERPPQDCLPWMPLVQNLS